MTDLITNLKTSDFDYNLPQELIAQTPLEPRDSSRLLAVNRTDSSITHRRFFELPEYLKAGDVLVFNNSRVIRARLFGNREDTGKRIEILLLRRMQPNTWEALIGAKKRVEAGLKVEIEGTSSVKAEVIEIREAGIRVVRFSDDSIIPQVGHVPLPPYIHTPLADPERYQTVYAEKEGSVAAPTAGLHFTPELLQKIQGMGVLCVFVTLHVGLNTFRPVQVENIREHPIFPEYGVISREASEQINRAKSEGRRVICVGTTSVRLVESAAHAEGRLLRAGHTEDIQRVPAEGSAPRNDGISGGLRRDEDGLTHPAAKDLLCSPSLSFSPLEGETREGNEKSPLNPPFPKGEVVELKPWEGWVNDFIYPGYRFKVMDALITNFHLPKSTLLMLVSAFAGKELIFKAYHEAIEKRYRFYSFGDAMLIL